MYFSDACPRASLAATHSHPVCSFARDASFVGCVWVVLLQAQAIRKINPHPCTIALGKWAPACPRVSLPQKHTRTPCAVLQGLSHSSGACGWCCYKHKPSGKINPCPWTAALGKWATACPRASLAETHSHPVCSFARAASFVGSC